MGFEDDIKQWIKLDNETKQYNEQLLALQDTLDVCIKLYDHLRSS